MQLLQYKKHYCSASEQVSIHSLHTSAFKVHPAVNDQVATNVHRRKSRCKCKVVVACVNEDVQVEVRKSNPVDAHEEEAVDQVVRPLEVQVSK